MAIIVDATYEEGVLKPAEPLPLAEHEKVRVTIEPSMSRAEASYGLLGWKGDLETVQRIALDKGLEYYEDKDDA